MDENKMQMQMGQEELAAIAAGMTRDSLLLALGYARGLNDALTAQKG